MYAVPVPDHAFAERLGAVLRTALLYRELTMEELAHAAGFSTESIRRWVRGDTNISAVDLAHLADVLGVPAEVLLDPPATRSETLVRMAAFDALRSDPGAPRP